MVAPKEASMCTSKGPEGEWFEKSLISSLRVAVSKERSCRWNWWKTLNQYHIMQCLLWLKERNGDNIMERTENAEGAAWLQREEFAGRSTKGKSKEEGEVNEDGGETRIRSQSLKKWLKASRKRSVCMMVSRRLYKERRGKVFMRSCDCSQIENEVEEGSWREGDQMAAQWEEEQQLEGIVERRRIEGNFLQLDVTQKVLELVVHERMSRGKMMKYTKEKKKVSGWSIEKMKEKPNIAVVEDTEEMR